MHVPTAHNISPGGAGEVVAAAGELRQRVQEAAWQLHGTMRR